MRARCARHRRERSLRLNQRRHVMANTLGNFTKLDTGAFTGTFKTLNVNASLSIVPVDKMSEDAPDHRVYAGPGQRYEVAAPEFGPYAIYCRLVKLEQPAEDGATHMILWEPRDR